MIEDHFESVRESISKLAWITESVTVQSEIGPVGSMGTISGILIFKNGSTFHFNEVHLQNTQEVSFPLYGL